MHFKDDPISDIHAKNCLIILSLKHFPGPTKFSPIFWSRLFQRGPVEYNYPLGMNQKTQSYNYWCHIKILCIINIYSKYEISKLPICEENNILVFLGV